MLKPLAAYLKNLTDPNLPGTPGVIASRHLPSLDGLRGIAILLVIGIIVTVPLLSAVCFHWINRDSVWFNVAALSVVACLSYYGFERPILRLKDRIMARPAAQAGLLPT